MKEEHEEQQIAALLRLAGPRPRVSEEVAARVRARAHDEWRRGLRQRMFVRVASVAAAAVIVIAAAALFVARPRPTAPFTPLPPVVAKVQAIRGTANFPLVAGNEIRQGTRLETHAGSTLSLDWNGAVLRLAEGTRLRFHAPREATLERGAMYFDGRQARVTIRTPHGDVRDIGTMFEVRVDENTLRVRVREGRVDLRRGLQRWIADAATELVASGAGVERRPIEVSGAEWKWIEDAAPLLRLEGLTLREALTRVAREKGLRVELRGVDGNARLHGNTEFTPDEALDAAAAATAASYRVERGVLVVRSSR